MTPLPRPDHAARLARARLALDGLSVGDAFGERFFIGEEAALRMVEMRSPPPPPWAYTDDTEMALAAYTALERDGEIDPTSLASLFAARYMADPSRGYGGTAHSILRAIDAGEPWSVAAARVFGGMGSMGNGAAMRVAPIGAYFADEIDAAVAAARESAIPTHSHAEGVAGAIAVTAAAAFAWRSTNDAGFAGTHAADGLLAFALARTPPGATQHGIATAIDIGREASVRLAVSALGNGTRLTAPDTVPFTLWCADRHLASYEDALWTTVSGLGDRDTTCAIVGGIVALHTNAIPARWLAAREPLKFDATPR